jgi:ferredoxin
MNDSYTLRDPRLLVAGLLSAGWRVIAPVVQDGALVPSLLDTAADLPRGYSDVQAPGAYRLERGASDRWFDAVIGPQGWKRWLHPPERRLWTAHRDGQGFDVIPEAEVWPPTVFFGVRPCDLAAIMRQAEVFRRAGDRGFGERLAATRLVAVNCTRAVETCFCASMGTGPQAGSGFDLALTELQDGILVEPATEAGLRLLDGLALRAATREEIAAARAGVAATAESQARAMPPDIQTVLRDAAGSPRWDEIATRCLHCANCTMVCPTCFCTDVVDRSDLSGETAERWQRWDSCFAPAFSHLHGGAVRHSGAARYRQWMTHKLSAWHTQFGTSGCTGCGRCITWCPTGIDLVAEARAFAEEG